MRRRYPWPLMRIRGRCGAAEHGLVFAYSPNGDTFYDLNKVSNIIDLSNYDDSDKAFYTVNGALQALPIAKYGPRFYMEQDNL